MPHPSPSARFWDRIAPRYARAAIADQAGYEKTFRRVSGLLAPTHTVLELGCGTGTTALRLAPHARSLLATDASPEMVAIARERLHAQPTPGLTFAVADADLATFDTAGYDRVLAFNLLHLLADLEQALAAIAHTLRPGGLFISKTPCIAEMNPLITHLAVPLMRAVGKAPPLLRFDEAQLHSAIRRAGLEVIATERHGTRGKDVRAFVVARKPAAARA